MWFLLWSNPRKSPNRGSKRNPSTLWFLLYIFFGWTQWSNTQQEWIYNLLSSSQPFPRNPDLPHKSIWRLILKFMRGTHILHNFALHPILEKIKRIITSLSLLFFHITCLQGQKHQSIHDLKMWSGARQRNHENVPQGTTKHLHPPWFSTWFIVFLWFFVEILLLCGSPCFGYVIAHFWTVNIY